MSDTVAAVLPGGVSGRRLGVVFGGLMLVMLLAALDATIVATVLPTIAEDLGGLEHLSWVTSAFLLAQTAVIPLYGKLGDQLGRKRVLLSAVVLFLVGSGLCGIAGSMAQLIAFRAVQGLGAGGLIVLVLATVGDVVSPRERGRYQGLFGVVFGLASVAGPLLGGVIVQNVSWRWVFYVNLPAGLVALAVLWLAVPAMSVGARPAIDYTGAVVLAAAVSAIVLIASLGGSTWPWRSAQTVLVGATAVLLLGAFVLVERHAPEPILPAAVSRNDVFRVAALLSLVAGFVLFGSVTFLPLFFQTVFRSSPTGAGLRLIPLVGGLAVTSIVSGRLISRTGRYKPFPIAGTVVMTVGLILLSRLGVNTTSTEADAYLLVLGFGLGMVMPVLILAVQNAVDYAELGVATSGVTLARGIGGAFGAAVFGTIFTSRLRAQLHGALSGAIGDQLAAGGRLTGAQVARLPAHVRLAYEQAYVHALGPVFLVAAGLGAVGFVLSLWLRQRPLRATASTSRGLEDALAAPRSPNSLAELDRALCVLAGRDAKGALNRHLVAGAGTELTPAAVWALARLLGARIRGTRETASKRARERECFAVVAPELREHGLIEGRPAAAQLTPAGIAVADRVLSASRDELQKMIGDRSALRTAEVRQLIERLCVELSGEQPEPHRRLTRRNARRHALARGAQGPRG